MAGFVAQVWVLCAVAFLLGSGVTWLVFVRPRPAAEAAAPAVAVASEPVPAAAPPEAPAEDPPAPPSDPALTALDAPATRSPGTGARASSTLDLLGVTPSGLAPTIPTQPGPVDDDGHRT